MCENGSSILISNRVYNVSILPEGLNVYTHQIGGHNPNKGVKFKFAYDRKTSTVFKLISDSTKGFNEVRIYEEVFQEPNSSSILKSFLPAYRGLFINPLTKRYFIAMEDILMGMRHPSACDIKLGQHSFLPDANDMKKHCELSKYCWRKALGFFITGINVYDRVSGSDTFFDINYGRSLTPESVYEQGICLFFGKNEAIRVNLARAFLVHLKRLLAWFESQRSHQFVASSLYLAYDSTAPFIHCPSLITHQNLSVRLIDFARCRIADDNESLTKDENCLFGIYKLIQLFQKAASTRLNSTSGDCSVLSVSDRIRPPSSAHST